jgi:hypothetical protein
LFQRASQLASVAANNTPFENGDDFSPSTVSQGPPPSFLVSTPLGVPLEESVGSKPIVENHQPRQHNVGGQTVSLARTPKGANDAPKQLKKRAAQLKKPVKAANRVGKKGIKYRWINQEVRLSMSKMSIMSLVLGLLFLSTLFFIIGFLAAVTTLKSEEGKHPPQSAWQASNQPAQDGPPGGKLGKMAAHMGGSILGREVRHELSPVRGALVSAAKIVPKPLQPFARYGMGSANVKVRQAASHVNPFHRGRSTGAQQQYQQYPAQQQAQSYAPPGSPQMPYGNQAPTAYPQGGGQVYGQPQQQQMQPPPQQMSQQMLVPQQQMIPQQQYQQPMVQPMMQQPQQPQYQQPMMQQPQQQFQQPMVPQQGYYR